MTVSNLIKKLQNIVAQDPSTAKLQFLPEPRRVWQHYHLYTGFSKRGQFGKKDQIVWRFK